MIDFDDDDDDSTDFLKKIGELKKGTFAVIEEENSKFKSHGKTNEFFEFSIDNTGSGRTTEEGQYLNLISSFLDEFNIAHDANTQENDFQAINSVLKVEFGEKVAEAFEALHLEYISPPNNDIKRDKLKILSIIASKYTYEFKSRFKNLYEGEFAIPEIFAIESVDVIKDSISQLVDAAFQYSKKYGEISKRDSIDKKYGVDTHRKEMTQFISDNIFGPLNIHPKQIIGGFLNKLPQKIKDMVKNARENSSFLKKILPEMSNKFDDYGLNIGEKSSTSEIVGGIQGNAIKVFFVSSMLSSSVITPLGMIVIPIMAIKVAAKDNSQMLAGGIRQSHALNTPLGGSSKDVLGSVHVSLDADKDQKVDTRDFSNMSYTERVKAESNMNNKRDISKDKSRI